MTRFFVNTEEKYTAVSAIGLAYSVNALGKV